jgi:non-ribosomal peptide synthetase component E (peptide arylation enzyme)
MLPGFVPFPPEFVARYREKGYWNNLSLAQEFAVLYKNTLTEFCWLMAIINLPMQT